MSDLQKLFRLNAGEISILFSAIIFLPVVALLLKHRGFRKTESFLASLGRSGGSPEASCERVRSIARMVSIASDRGPYKARCLEQAITLWWMLGLLGIFSTVRMGIYKHGDAIEAHAWVLYGDEIVIGELDRLGDYTPILDVNLDRDMKR